MQNKLKALIVDDETPARHDLKDQLENFQSIEIVGEADSIDSTIKAIRALNPDIIFLDIQFPGETGFDLFEKTDVKARVVFVTAFDEYAIRAFEVNACDYLLKPVNPKRLAQTLERLTTNIPTTKRINNKFNYQDKIFLELNYKFYFIKISSIIIISSAGSYTEIITSTRQKGLTSKLLKDWEDCLPKENFMRIHRSTIINQEFIDKIIKLDNFTSHVFMKGYQEPLMMSRRFVRKFREQLYKRLPA
jgi:two-component system, LytTR family, response regulator